MLAVAPPIADPPVDRTFDLIEQFPRRGPLVLDQSLGQLPGGRAGLARQTKAIEDIANVHSGASQRSEEYVSGRLQVPQPPIRLFEAGLKAGRAQFAINCESSRQPTGCPARAAF